MIKVENIETWGFEHAIRGMRNPMNSWQKSDSFWCIGADGFEDCRVLPLGDCPRHGNFQENIFCVGSADLKLMQKLFKGGTEHRKYLRQIFISVDITAPLYWWKEFDTYKIGTVTNSCSTMHKIHSKRFELNDFSIEHLIDEDYCWWRSGFSEVVNGLNVARDNYLETKDKRYWWQMIQLLPNSYNQKRTVTMTYENAVSMINQRSEHKLDEWREFVKMLEGLPYITEIIGICHA